MIDRVMITLSFLLLLISCMKTEIINTPEVEVRDTLRVKSIKEPPSIPEPSDTSRVPITFNPTVEDWKEI